ncbi:hypothetical protein [Bradyrhizobium sp. S69]|uniref:hypothetical protein n=1 Tax=Bradyrhizobium sp. S69 TaxID=1641856 RepID=UPI00131AE1AB|nr:hypothetical protein [Bradyrhizobium sp. S69]
MAFWSALVGNYGDSAPNYCGSRLDDDGPAAHLRLEADSAARRKNFHLVAAFDFRRQFVLNGTRAEYDHQYIEAVTAQRPIMGEGVSPDLTPNSRRCAPAVALTDFAMMKQCC